MDPINPWIDANEVRQLAEQLLQHHHKPKATPQTPGFSDSFIGFDAISSPAADSIPAAAIPAVSIPAAPIPVAAIPATSAPSAPVSAAPSHSDSASPWSMLHTYLKQTHAADGLFVLNSMGEPIYGKDQLPKLQFIAQSLAAQPTSNGQPKHHIHLKVGPAAVLEIIPVVLPTGPAIIGTVVQAPLNADQINAIAAQASRISR